jgi:hypothetical protein
MICHLWNLVDHDPGKRNLNHQVNILFNRWVLPAYAYRLPTNHRLRSHQTWDLGRPEYDPQSCTDTAATRLIWSPIGEGLELTCLFGLKLNMCSKRSFQPALDQKTNIYKMHHQLVCRSSTANSRNWFRSFSLLNCSFYSCLSSNAQTWHWKMYGLPILQFRGFPS